MENNQVFDSNGNIQTQPPLPRWENLQHRRVWLNILLFLTTIGSTMMIGASLLGYDMFAIIQEPARLLSGWQYSFAVLLILTCHEFGHYFAARWHKMNVTLPFYIPLPIPFMFHFGTMGAFIRLKSPLPDRCALMDVAVAGPLAGFVVSLGFLVYGYATLPDLSGIIAHVETVHPWAETGGEQGFVLTLGSSLLFSFFNDTMGQGLIPMSEVYHFPFIFAGWAGLLVTAINLIPIGQLDGGHIVYALFGREAGKVSRLAFWGLGGMTLFLFFERGSVGAMWVPWMIILSLIGLRHPPTYNDKVELNAGRRQLGWLCILIFILCFMPLPLHF